MSKLWRCTVGIKGLNRITVYERVPDGPIQVLWYDRYGQHRETMKNMRDVPVYDKEKAVRIAEEMAAAQREKREAPLRGLLNIPDTHTVGELFTRIFKDEGAGWSKKWKRDQRRYRKFWETALGLNTDITTVLPADVANAVKAETQARIKANDPRPAHRPWEPKTQNHYLNAAVAAWNYAERQLKWITPAQNLEAVKRHQVDEDNWEIAYESAEVHSLLPTLEEIDLRAWVCGELAYIGGRRITAIRTLPASCYRTESRIMPDAGVTEFGVVTFPAKTDKARKKGEVYLVGPPKRAIEALLATLAVQASGHLFPKGELDSLEPPPLPITEKVLRRWLRQAEDECGVAQVEGRSYHAFKRAFATDAEGSLEGASAQSGTTRETLLKIYRQPKPAEKAALALQLDGLRRA